MRAPDPAAEPEDALFERWCRRGDGRALGELFDALAPRLLRLAIHLVGDAAEAEDLVQATFLTALERRASLDPSRPVAPWLTGVLVHKAQQHRRRAARVPDADRLARAEVEDASRPLERRELDGEVARAIDGLGEPYRAVLLLRLRHGMEAADIAHVLERDAGTVRVQLHRGLEKLRAVLPAALATTLALGILAPRGLAAVKAAVQQGAAASAAGTAAATTANMTIGGSLVGKKVLVGAAVLALAALAWVRSASEGGGTPRKTAPRPNVAPAQASAAPVRATPSGAASEDVAATSQRVAAAHAAPERRLQGRVVDAESKAPIAGARLAWFPPHAATAFELQRDWPELYEVQADGALRARTHGDWPRLAGSPAERVRGERLASFDRPRPGEEPLRVTRTDDSGGFELEFVEEGLLEVAFPGYSTRWRPGLAPGEALTIELWREREVHGRVLGPGLEPVPDLELVLTSARSVAWRPAEPVVAGESQLRVSVIPEEEVGLEAYGCWRARTDAEGRFRARIGAAQLRAFPLTPGWRAEPIQHSSVDGQGGELTLRVARVPEFHVHDALDGSPIEHVRLLGIERANRYVRWAGEFFAPEGRLDVPGELSYAKQGTVCFVLWSTGHLPARVSVADLASAGTIEVPMERGTGESLQGVVTRGGESISGAEVVLLGHSPLQWGVDEDFYVAATRTDDHGRFELSAPAGTYLLRLREHDEPFLERVVFAAQPNTWNTRAIEGNEPFFQVVELPGARTLTLDLDATGTLEVEIVDTRGAPQDEHIVALRGDDGRQLGRHTDAEGLARFGNLPAGRYRLHTPLVTTVGSFAGGELREVELGPAARERVRIELPAQDGPRHLRVAARDASTYAGWRARYDQEEWVELLPDGTVPLDLATTHWELEIAAGDGRQWHLEIPKGARDGQVIELEEGVLRYRGVLRRADGRPWPAVAVHALAHASDAPRVACVTDERGEFDLPGLRAGPYRLRFQTNLERTVWDDWGNDFACQVYEPAAAPSVDGTWLAIQAAEPRPRTRFAGVVLDASGVPIPEAQLSFEGEEPGPDGRFLIGGRDHFIHADEQGSFELELARTPRVTVRVHARTDRAPVVTQVLEPLRATETLRLVVP